jgi:hypothetical protein
LEFGICYLEFAEGQGTGLFSSSPLANRKTALGGALQRKPANALHLLRFFVSSKAHVNLAFPPTKKPIAFSDRFSL